MERSAGKVVPVHAMHPLKVVYLQSFLTSPLDDSEW